MSTPVLVLVTTESEPDALTIARALVAEGLIAGANLLPVSRSVYAWKGETEEDQARSRAT